MKQGSSKLQLEERISLFRLHQRGHSQAAIARGLGRHRATIGRELQRNTPGSRDYLPEAAQREAQARRYRGHRCQRDPDLGEYVETRLGWGWKVDNPCAGCRLPEPEGRVRWLTFEQAETLIEAAGKVPKSPHLADFVQLGLYTGLRKGEMLGLEWSRVDLERDLIYLEAAHQKGKRRSSAPLNRRARQALENRRRWVAEHCLDSPWVFCWKSGKRITDVKNGFKTALAKAGITDFRIHDLRHTYASWLVMEGVDLYRVRDLLRHRSITETERYAHLAPDLAAEAASTLDRVGGKAGNESAGAGALVQN